MHDDEVLALVLSGLATRACKLGPGAYAQQTVETDYGQRQHDYRRSENHEQGGGVPPSLAFAAA